MRLVKSALCASVAVCVAVSVLLTGEASYAQGQGFALNRFDPAERGSDWFVLDSLDLRGHLRPAVGLRRRLGLQAARPVRRERQREERHRRASGLRAPRWLARPVGPRSRRREHPDRALPDGRRADDEGHHLRGSGHLVRRHPIRRGPPPARSARRRLQQRHRVRGLSSHRLAGAVHGRRKPSASRRAFPSPATSRGSRTPGASGSTIARSPRRSTRARSAAR